MGEPFDEADRTKFVARYIERGPISLEKLTISDSAKASSGHRRCKGGPRHSCGDGGRDDIITYTTKDERVHEFDAMEFLALLSCHIPKPYESITRYYGCLVRRSLRRRRIFVQGARLARQAQANSRPPSPRGPRTTIAFLGAVL